MGPELQTQGRYGTALPPGMNMQLEEGIETTITQGFSVGLEATFLTAITAGVNYQCKYYANEWVRGTMLTLLVSVSETQSKMGALSFDASDEYYMGWV